MQIYFIGLTLESTYFGSYHDSDLFFLEAVVTTAAIPEFISSESVNCKLDVPLSPRLETPRPTWSSMLTVKNKKKFSLKKVNYRDFIMKDADCDGKMSQNVAKNVTCSSTNRRSVARPYPFPLLLFLLVSTSLSTNCTSTCNDAEGIFVSTKPMMSTI